MTTENSSSEYNIKYYYNNALHQLSPKKTAFKTFVLSNGLIVGTFQGKKGDHPELDFVVKILRKGSNEKAEPPIHTYWVVDLMLKSHSHPDEIREILDYYIDFYDNCAPFETVEERNSYTPQTVDYIMRKYGHIDARHTLPMDYIALVIELFCLCEKRNNGAYMFRNILHILKDYIDGNADYMNVIKASMPLNRRR